MHNTLNAPPSTPDFPNIRRQASIDWLLSIKIDPFQKVKNNEDGECVDFYVHDMNEMPRLTAETDWELGVMRSHCDDLATRIATARTRR